MTLSKCPNVDVFGLGPVTPRSKRAHDHETEHHPAALLAALQLSVQWLFCARLLRVHDVDDGIAWRDGHVRPCHLRG